MGKLDGKIAIITGCSNGIGKAYAKRFAVEGAKVSICDVDVEGLEKTAEECRKLGSEVLAMRCDVTKLEDMEAFVKETARQFGTIDILLNNCCVGIIPCDFEKIIVEKQFKLVFESGFMSTFHMMQLCFPYMKEHGGKILNIGSLAGTNGLADLAGYAATKEAIRAISRVAAREWGEYNINVNVLCPNAFTDTMEKQFEKVPQELREKALKKIGFVKGALGRWGNPYDDIAPVAVFLCSDDARFITGQTLHVEGGQDIYS